MKLVARLVILVLIPLSTLVACSKEDNQGAVDSGNQAGKAAYAAKVALNQNHGIDLDYSSSARSTIQSLNYEEILQVRRDLVEFRRLTQSFLDWGHSRNVQFIGNSEQNATAQMQTADQLITVANQRIDSFAQGSNSNRPRGQNRTPRDHSY